MENNRYFLKQLSEYRHRTTYIKIIALDIKNNPIDEIQGRATGGSISIDGASAVRRTCSLTMVADDVNINEYLWSMKTRFELFIGLKNEIDSTQDDIVWIKQGVFVITQFSASLNTNSYTISISGQDKMCLLNGEVGGVLTAETDFGKYDELDDNGEIIETIYLPVGDIIRNIVKVYAQELDDNVLIDIPENSGIRLIEYRGEDPMYIMLKEEEGEYQAKNLTIYGDQTGHLATVDDEGNIIITQKEVKLEELPKYWKPAGLVDSEPDEGSIVSIGGELYQIRKVKYGETAGYESTELTYANGELTAAAGESVTSVLDKIKNMLGEYEYFYDTDGKFIFQKKKIYLKTIWNDSDNIITNSDEQYSYYFDDLSLFTSFSNSPDLKNLKNDFTVWGKRKSVSGADLPIHMRVAIDVKPQYYVSPWRNSTSWSIEDYDYRELIYQMAVDYMKHNRDENFLDSVEAYNPWAKGGRTGYEQYYTDLYSFWRDLYNPEEAAKLAYEETYFTDEDAIWWRTWKEVAQGGTLAGSKLEDYSRDELYIDKEIPAPEDKVRIKWINSLDLNSMIEGSEQHFALDSNGNRIVRAAAGEKNPIGLRELYTTINSLGDKDRVMRTTNFGENTYFVKENNEFLPLSHSYSWRAQDNIDKLWYKEIGKNNFIPLVKRKRASKETIDNFQVQNLKPYIWFEDGTRYGTMLGIKGNITKIEIYGKGWEGNINPPFDWNTTYKLDEQTITFFEVFKKALKDSTSIIKFKYEGGGEREVIYSSLTTFLYLDEISYLPDETNYSLWIDNEGTKELYVNYLATVGVATNTEREGTAPLNEEGKVEEYQKIIDEFFLYTYDKEKKQYRGLIEDFSFKRSELLAINDEGKYVPFYEVATSLPSKAYVLDSEITKIGADVIKEETETYYLTDYKGHLIPDMGQQRKIHYYKQITPWDEEGWNYQIQNEPNTLSFWFQFIDPTQVIDLAKFSVPEIGSRNMAKNDNTATAIYYPETPGIYFGTDFQLPKSLSDNYFITSSQGLSAYDVINSWLYNYTYVTESVTINSIPIYHLEPNTRIRVFDKDYGIDRDYIINRLNIPLTYNGTMSITASQVPEGTIDLDEID